MEMPKALQLLLDGQDLNSEQMHTIMHLIMAGKTTPAQIAGFLIALRLKGETVNEIAAAATVMRELATPVNITGQHVLIPAVPVEMVLTPLIFRQQLLLLSLLPAAK